MSDAIEFDDDDDFCGMDYHCDKFRGQTMFHWNDNMYFGRHYDGGVRILKFSAPLNQGEWPKVTESYHDVNVILDVTIPASQWASIVASVSKSGEQDGRYYKAEKFHQE